jgi:hypothetical protein
MSGGDTYWVITIDPHEGEDRAWWGKNRSGGGWTPYPGNAHHYESEGAALYIVHQTPSLKRYARGEVKVEQRSVAPPKGTP